MLLHQASWAQVKVFRTCFSCLLLRNIMEARIFPVSKIVVSENTMHLTLTQKEMATTEVLVGLLHDIPCYLVQGQRQSPLAQSHQSEFLCSGGNWLFQPPLKHKNTCTCTSRGFFNLSSTRGVRPDHNLFTGFTVLYCKYIKILFSCGAS